MRTYQHRTISRHVMLCCCCVSIVDGSWTAWSRWLDCSVTCGLGQQRRYRNCQGAANGGNTCPGAAEEYRDCNAGPCPGNITTITTNSNSNNVTLNPALLKLSALSTRYLVKDLGRRQGSRIRVRYRPNRIR